MESPDRKTAKRYMDTLMIYQFLAEKCGKKYAAEVMKKSKKVYRELVEKADDIGDDNPMAYNELFALAFVAPYVASEKKIPPTTVQEMMRRSLYHIKWYFAKTDLNTVKGLTNLVSIKARNVFCLLRETFRACKCTLRGLTRRGNRKRRFLQGEGLQQGYSPVMKRKSFVGCQMLASSDIIYVKTGL